jgi:TolA-binding protein
MARTVVTWRLAAGLVLLGLTLVLAGPFVATGAEKRLTEIEQQLLEIRQIRETLADHTATLSRLQEEVAQLRGAVEELRHQVKSPATAELERRLAKVEASLTQGAQPAGQPGGPTPTAPTTSTPPTKPTPPLTEDEAFDRAKNLYTQGKMADARAAFKKFVEEFPASNKIPSAKDRKSVV